MFQLVVVAPLSAWRRRDHCMQRPWSPLRVHQV